MNQPLTKFHSTFTKRKKLKGFRNINLFKKTSIMNLQIKLAFLFSSVYFLFNAQISIKGKIIQNDSSLVPFCNAILISPIDSSFISGELIENGNLQLTTNQRNFILKITSESFRDTLFLFKDISSDIDLGSIQLEELQDLSEVVVSASIPLFVRKEGNTIVNIENTMLASSTSLIELLTKTPSVKMGENSLSVFGRGEALIYLNGKQINYERLGSIPVNRITKIEIITNPSAKYDAGGRAVININTMENNQEGFNGQIAQTNTQAKYFLNTSAFNLNYKKGKFSLFSDYSLSLGRDWNKGTYDKTITTATEIFTSHNETEERAKLTNVSNYRLGINYDLNKHSDLSLQYDGLYNRYDLPINALTTINSSLGDKTILNVVSNDLTINTNNSFNMNYNNQIDTLGSSLFIGTQYCNFNTLLYDQIDESMQLNDSINSRAFRINDGLNVIQLFTAQIDYLKVFKNNSKLELGAKYSDISNNGRIKFKSRVDGSEVWQEYPQFTNNFLYLEKVPAIYGQYSKTIKEKWQTSFGVRSEFSHVEGISKIMNTKVIDSNYINFFPSAKITFTKNENTSHSLSFSSRINRPMYQNIDPFVWYNDSLTSSQGNPKLIPANDYSGEFQTIYKAFSVRVGYTYTKNTIRGLPIIGQNGPNSIIYSKFNLKHSHQFNCSFEIPIEKKYINSYNTISGSYEKVAAFAADISTQQAKPQLYIYSYNQLKLIKNLKIDVSGEFTSAYSNGITNYKANCSFGLGVSKSFFNKKLVTRLMVNDLFRTYYTAGNSSIGIIQSSSHSKLNTFFIRLSLVYKFGRMKEPTNKNKTVNDDEFNRIRQ